MRTKVLIRLALGALFFSSVVSAQSRTRQLGRLGIGDASATVEAKDDGKVWVYFSDEFGVNTILADFQPPDVRRWADSAAAVLAARVTAEKGETVRVESSILHAVDDQGRPQESMQITRVIGERPSMPPIFVFVTEAQSADRIHELTSEKNMTKFLDLLRKAADAADEMVKKH